MINKLQLIFTNVTNFYLVFLDRFGLVKNYIIYYLNNTLVFVARAGTEDVSEIVVVSSGYEYPLKEIQFSKNPVILDFGSFIGTFSLYAANFLKNKCKIYAFEPNSDNYSMLIANICLNKCTSIVPYNLAVSDYAGPGSLANSINKNDAYYLKYAGKLQNNCMVTTVKDIWRDNNLNKIDLLKMDIEGEEYKLFLDKQTYGFFKNNVHYILLEIHTINDHYNYDFLYEIIKDDFIISRTHSNILKLENTKWKK
jgi:FkbM family methyltransferase